MSLNAATIEFLLSKGLTGDDLLAVAQRMELTAKPRSAAAARQARYRQRKAESVTSDVTGDVTRPPKENKSNPPSSEAIASGAGADPAKQMFDLGVELLTSTGCTEKQARSLIGKWRKVSGESDVIGALLDCRARAISNPVEWLEKRFSGQSGYVSASGYVYRGDLDAVQREAKRRSDMDTYWQVEIDRKRRAAA